MDIEEDALGAQFANHLCARDDLLKVFPSAAGQLRNHGEMQYVKMLSKVELPESPVAVQPFSASSGRTALLRLIPWDRSVNGTRELLGDVYS
ncbi:hypothetical protein CRENBAI_001682 [Crenichthys baileyi]|uniref:Uncharacterized protein n=1 Tax=Crenichthys baileyi TaxID=28760 RepID=A0AAV9RNW2_9TELE